MSRFLFVSSTLILLISIIFYNSTYTKSLYNTDILVTNPYTHKDIPALRTDITATTTTTTTALLTKQEYSQQLMLNAVKNTMSKTLHHAKITPHRSSARGHSDHGWLNTYHSFSFADWYNPRFNGFGSLRVLNEDRVKANSGFPTHPHRDFEIFSYVLSGELTHRDSMLQKGAEGAQSDRFYRMRRGDVQFTTGGTGIAHSEFNEDSTRSGEPVHFLQIWAIPWKRGLEPRYHTRHFDEEQKRLGFVPILSPLKGGVDASREQEKAAEPTIPGTIPIHADFVMAAGLVAPEGRFEWNVGAKAAEATKRKVYVHLPMTKRGKAKVRLDGREDAVLSEGDGAFVDGVNAGDKLAVESIGDAEAEVIVLDTA
ncbi:RmlC-like cupin domain-containing protein [Diplogelasinospora grovesii]|uniref:RmlC-like cupin domain-containing protein n=1 Tax=Diplogelasinospora grovesii TaxID=303347 RepID=A0AAN6NDZ2_9PEZI|nr:RmlC-like cupin domain-containing protein [Diplogelasinospora grovesii]